MGQRKQKGRILGAIRMARGESGLAVPRETLWFRSGVTPAETERLRAQRGLLPQGLDMWVPPDTLIGCENDSAKFAGCGDNDLICWVVVESSGESC